MQGCIRKAAGLQVIQWLDARACAFNTKRTLILTQAPVRKQQGTQPHAGPEPLDACLKLNARIAPGICNEE